VRQVTIDDGPRTARSGGTKVGTRRRVRFAAFVLVALLFLPAAGLVSHIYFNRRDLPDLEPFIRFELPTTGQVFDARGEVLIALAREYRSIISYDDVPVVLRQAILAAEDKNFFSHSGVDYGVLPRVVQKAAARSLDTWWHGDERLRLRLPQGGSTLTQQLVRGYFLADRTRHEDRETLFRRGFAPWLLSVPLGIPAANKLLRKLEEVRLSLWVEREMKRLYGSRERAKREIFGRYASYIYLGNGRYGFAAASEYYFDKPLARYALEDAGKAALLAGISKSPRDYAPVPGDPRPLRRRNQILAVMERNGTLSEALARRLQSEPIWVAPLSPMKTEAPAAVEGVFDELRRHGGDRFGIEDLFLGRISIRTTVDGRVQAIVNEALEHGLVLYERRHPKAQGIIQGSVVVLRNSDAAILAEAGGRQMYLNRQNTYSDLNRVTGSMRQPGSAWKPLVYLAAFRTGMNLESTVPDEPINVPTGADGEVKWIANYDGQFKGPMSARQALAESRNTVAVWLTREVGLERLIRTARDMGIRSPVHRYLSTALGASEVRLLELAGVYRAIASGVLAEPHVIDQVIDAEGGILYSVAPPAGRFHSTGLDQIQEGLRGVVRLPGGTANVLNRGDFPIPVMGKTGTTSDFRDALFIGSTYGSQGITVAVRIGFDDNRTLGVNETGGRAALPIFREVMLRVYQDQLVGFVPVFPREIEDGIDGHMSATAGSAVMGPGGVASPPPGHW